MYEAGLSKVAVVVTVHHTTQPRLCVEVARARVGVLHLHGTCQLIIRRIEHIVALSPEIIAIQTIVLVSSHNLHVVLVELLVPVQTLLVVIAPSTSVVNHDNTVRRRVLTEVRVGGLCRAALAQIVVVDRGQSKSERQTQLQFGCSIEGVARSVVAVELSRRELVTTAQIWTGDTNHLTVTIVVHVDASSVAMHDVTLTITDVKRIDRSHHGHGKHVTRRAAFTIVAYHVAVVVTIGHVHAHLQP